MTEDPSTPQNPDQSIRDLLSQIIQGQNQIHQSNQALIQRMNALLMIMQAISKS